MDKQQLLYVSLSFSCHLQVPRPQATAHLWWGYFIESVALPAQDRIAWHPHGAFPTYFLQCCPSSSQFKVTLPFGSWSPLVPYVLASRHLRSVGVFCVCAMLIVVAMAPCRRGCPGSVQRGVMTGSTQLDVLTERESRHFGPVRPQTLPSSNVCLDTLMKALSR